MRFFGLYFIIEIILLVVAGRFLGVWLTLLIIVATSIVGVLVLRLAGFSTMIKVRQKLAQGEAPNAEMMNGLLLGVGGGFLFLPGLLGNIMGLLLVVPMTRKSFIDFAKKILKKYTPPSQATYTNSTENVYSKVDVIEAEWERKDK